MAMPTWNQAGGQVRAEKLTSYGDALKPVVDWANRAVEVENRKAEIDKKNQFMTERDAIKNQWAQDAADKKMNFTASENEADRVISRSRNEDMAKYQEGSLRNQETQIEQSGKYNAGMLRLKQDDLRFRKDQATAKEKKESERRAASVQALKDIYGSSTVPTKKGVIGTKLVDNNDGKISKSMEYASQFDELGKKANEYLDSMDPEIKKMIASGATRKDVEKKVKELGDKLKLDGKYDKMAKLNGLEKERAKAAGQTDLEYAEANGLADRIVSVGRSARGKTPYMAERAKINNSLGLYDSYMETEKAASALSNKMRGEVASVPKLKENIIGDVVDDTANYQRLVDERNSIYQSAPLLDDAGSRAAEMRLRDISAKIKDYDNKRAALALERERGNTAEKEIAAGLYKLDKASAQKEFDRLKEEGDSSVEGYSFINWYKKEYGTSKK